jgi:hypothetical protein
MATATVGRGQGRDFSMDYIWGVSNFVTLPNQPNPVSVIARQRQAWTSRSRPGLRLHFFRDVRDGEIDVRAFIQSTHGMTRQRHRLTRRHARRTPDELS